MPVRRQFLWLFAIVMTWLAHAGSAWADYVITPDDAVSREVSVFVGSSNGTVTPDDAVSREVSVFVGSSNGTVTPDDAITREVSVFVGSSNGTVTPDDAVSREVSVFVGSSNGTVSPDDAVSRECSVYSGERKYLALQVTLLPNAIVSGGAAWRRVGTTAWRSSAATDSGVPIGSYSIEFKALTGYRTPATRSVSVLYNQTATLMVGYVSTSTAIDDEDWQAYR